MVSVDAQLIEKLYIKSISLQKSNSLHFRECCAKHSLTFNIPNNIFFSKPFNFMICNFSSFDSKLKLCFKEWLCLSSKCDEFRALNGWRTRYDFRNEMKMFLCVINGYLSWPNKANIDGFLCRRHHFKWWPSFNTHTLLLQFAKPNEKKKKKIKLLLLIPPQVISFTVNWVNMTTNRYIWPTINPFD